jgi:lysozyme family protein
MNSHELSGSLSAQELNRLHDQALLQARTLRCGRGCPARGAPRHGWRTGCSGTSSCATARRRKAAAPAEAPG